MASNIKNISKGRLLSADQDLNSDDMRILLGMTNTTLDTDKDTDNLGSYTIDRMDGANYADVALANEAVNVDDANDRAEFDSDDPTTWTALGNGTRQMQGYEIFEFITNDAGSFPLFWNDFTSTINPGGSNFTITVNAEGWFQL